MNKKYLKAIVLFFLLGLRLSLVDAFCQTTYDRASITTLIFDNTSNKYNSRAKQAFSKYKVVDKYNDHNVQSRFANNTLPQKKVVNEVVAKWFNRKADGSFDMELIKERGVYNATDADVIQSQGSKRGKGALEDAGEKLINKSFIIILDYDQIENMPEYYDRMDNNIARYNKDVDDYNSKKKPADPSRQHRSYMERKNEGYMGEVMAYVYKLNWNDSINAVFYNELWIDAGDNDADKQKKAKKFDDFSFPVKFIGKTKNSLPLSRTQDKAHKYSNVTYFSDDELFNNLIADGLVEAYSFIEDFEDFKVGAPVFSTKPITAKIGLKEGVKVDQRYFVYEFVQNKNGETKTKRRGVVRASSKIVDNRQAATGQSEGSKFYQVAGRKLDKGMLLKQKNDIGLGMTASYGTPFLNFMLEMAPGGISGAKVFGELYFGFNQYPTYRSDLAKQNNWDEKALDSMGFKSTLSTSLFGYSVGLSKDVNFGRNFVWVPYASYGAENISLSKANYIVYDDYPYAANFGADSTLINSWQINIGCRLGINLLHNVQFLTTLGYSIIKSNSLGEGIETDKYLPEGVRNPSRKILTYGLRVQF